ncbi:MAG: histidinol-phosphatase [Candidatus Izemoplasmataceae bacterium]
MKTNYHTHHHLCKHAIGSAEDYIKVAIKHGFTDLGFSDHAPSDVINDENVRMTWDELPQYISDIMKNKGKYASQIRIHLGLEVEYYDKLPEYYEYLKEKTDYLILGQHYINDYQAQNSLQSSFALHKGYQLIIYAKSVVEAIKTGYFSLIAHPDLFMCGYPEFDHNALNATHIICKAAKKYNIPLEFNANGYRREPIETSKGLRAPYPINDFWKVAKTYDCDVIISSDAHAPQLLKDQATQKAEEVLKALRIDPITYLYFKR